MSTLEFQPWPKIARLNRDIIITEKIDGTNAAVVIVKTPWGPFEPDQNRTAVITLDNEPLANDGLPEFQYEVYAQSRTRFITPGKSTDNYGFAGWVERNAEALVATLGEGTHFGEWWGAGIQRSYGLTRDDKRFSLFNVKRWSEGSLQDEDGEDYISGLGIVPVLYEGPFSQREINNAAMHLSVFGSAAAPGFQRPEGIVVFHTASRESYKVTLEGDEAPKGAAAHARDEERVAA